MYPLSLRVKVFSLLLFQNLEEITKLVFNSPPRPLPPQTSASLVNLISKMLRKQSACRPRTDQLVLCPFLAPYIIRVYLNLGRSINLAERERESFGSHIFLKFLNSPRSKATFWCINSWGKIEKKNDITTFTEIYSIWNCTLKWLEYWLSSYKSASYRVLIISYIAEKFFHFFFYTYKIYLFYIINFVINNVLMFSFLCIVYTVISPKKRTNFWIIGT